MLGPPSQGSEVAVARTRLDGMADHCVLPVAHLTMVLAVRVQAETLRLLAEGRAAHDART